MAKFVVNVVVRSLQRRPQTAKGLAGAGEPCDSARIEMVEENALDGRIPRTEQVDESSHGAEMVVDVRICL